MKVVLIIFVNLIISLLFVGFSKINRTKKILIIIAAFLGIASIIIYVLPHLFDGSVRLPEEQKTKFEKQVDSAK